MKKMNYTRPLAEVIELEVTDIITASAFSETIGTGSVSAKVDAVGNLDAAVNEGTIKLN